jgi:hypothetical protein
MSGSTLALWAMPVTAGVVGDLLMLTGRTTQGMTAERRSAAGLDGRHHLELVEADVPRMCLTPRRSLGAEDVRDLQGLSGHDLTYVVNDRLSRGLVTSCSTSVATWV